ncbi:MAG: GNAT family N-acetyltransferase [Anaerolineaceae bacterium]
MISYQSFKDIDQTQLLVLYNDAGWFAYTQDPENLQRAVSNSWKVITAWEGEMLVGLIRCVSDGASVALIQDLLVLKSQQKLGIGSVLMEKMLEEIRSMRQIVLLTDASETNRETQEWYQKRGFKSLEQWECIGFAIFNSSLYSAKKSVTGIQE